jgi:hypothetical protein
MTRRNEHDPFIELLEDRTRLNLGGTMPMRAADPPAGPPKAGRRNRRRSLEFTGVPGDGHRHDAEFQCPACGAPGQLDIREGASGRCYLSCTSCFKMWQEVREPDKALLLSSEDQWQMR